VARTQKNIVDYFPHDADASDGDTLTIIEGLFGNDGYAFWFKLLEKLSRTENHYIDIKQNSKWQLFCSKAHITPEKAITIVKKLVELDALDAELWGVGIIWSEHFIDNLSIVYKNRRREPPSKPNVTDKRCFVCGKLLVDMREDAKFCSDKCRQKANRVTDKPLQNYGRKPLTTVEKPIPTIEKPIPTRKKAITTAQSRVEYSRVEKSRVNNIKEEEGTTTSFEDYQEKLRLKYPELNIADEWERCQIWYRDHKKEIKSPSLALGNWCQKEIKIQGDKKSSQDPDKYCKGKYGHMVIRTAADLKRIKELKDR